MAWWRSKSNTPTVGAHTDIGLVRTENQDAHGCFHDEESDGAYLYVVADGMGGHHDGRTASHLAIETVQSFFFDHPDLPLAERLEQAFRTAHARIRAYAESTDQDNMVGTTCTALAFGRAHVYLAHVGDSRAYRMRNGTLEQLTEDHTLVGQLMRDGVLTDEEARQHPRRNVLTSAMGILNEMQIDVADLGPPETNDTFLLCSDGLSRIPETDVHQTLTTLPPQEASEKLIALANDFGGQDNATALVVRFAT